MVMKMYWLLKTCRLVLVFLVAPVVLVACGGNGSSIKAGNVSVTEGKTSEVLSDIQKPEVVAAALTNDTQFMYVQRVVSKDAQTRKDSFNTLMADQAKSPLDLASPYEFQPGAQLILRSSLDVNGVDQEVLSSYFNSNGYDVKDLNVSADGQSLLFAAHGPSSSITDYTWNIYEYSFKTKAIRRVIADDSIANAGNDTNPTYALDGTIVFSSDRSAGNPNSPIDNIVDGDQIGFCKKVGPSVKPSLLHSMTSQGDNILQLTYGKNHDVKPTTLKDGRIAFVRWSHDYEVLTNCPAANTGASFDAIFNVNSPKGLDLAAKWLSDKKCALAQETTEGKVLASNTYRILRITVDGKELQQLYKKVELVGANESFIAPERIVQAENGRLNVVLSHQFSPYLGGNVFELQSPDSAQNDKAFGNLALGAIVPGNVDFHPNQRSVNGWYSAAWPYRDGTGRLLVSWQQCTTVVGGVSSFCTETTTSGQVNTQYGIWVIDPKTNSRLPVVRARKDAVYSDIVISQPNNVADYPFAANDAAFVDDLDAFRIVCDYPSSSSSSYSSYSSYYSSSYASSNYSSYASSASYSSASSVYVVMSSVASSYSSAPSSYSSAVSSYYSSAMTYSSRSVSSYVASSAVSSYAPSSVASSSSSNAIRSSVASSNVSVASSSVANSSIASSVVSSSLSKSSISSLMSSASSKSSSNSSASSMSSTSSSKMSSKSSSTTSACSSDPRNHAPVANAGVDRAAELGDVVKLDGSLSTDLDGDTLSYSWRLVSGPVGSVAEIVSNKSVNPTIAADKFGVYTVELVVNDGKLDSKPDLMTINTSNAAPIANAGPDQTVTIGEVALLNGTGSSDPEGQKLKYTWNLISKPAGSIVSLTNADQDMPQLKIDKAGSYVVQLIVNDGLENSAPDTVILTTKNSRPIAEAGKAITVYKGGTVTLDGSGSLDPDGSKLTYRWSISSKPLISNAMMSNKEIVNPQFIGDAEGTYVAQLIVNDGELDSDPDTVVVTVQQAPCDLSNNRKRSLPVTIRDFDVSHPDFEKFDGVDFGIVTQDLGADGLPVYAHPNGKTLTTSGAANFNQWFRDVKGVNITIPYSLQMSTDNSGSTIWTYTNNEFFPIDGLGFGNMPKPFPDHNYHFTLEAHFEFDYKGGEEFWFRGDDDLWVYINGKRVIDIGGVHGAMEQSVKLDARAAELGIQKGKKYRFDLFFAERHTYKSDFMFQTDLDLECVVRK